MESEPDVTPELIAWIWLALIVGFIVISVVRFGTSHSYWEYEGGTVVLLVSVVVLGTVTAAAAVITARWLGAGDGMVLFLTMIGYLIGLAASGLVAEYYKLMKAKAEASR